MNSALRRRCPLHLWRPNEGYTSANEFVGPSGALQRGYIRTSLPWAVGDFRGVALWIGVVVEPEDETLPVSELRPLADEERAFAKITLAVFANGLPK